MTDSGTSELELIRRRYRKYLLASALLTITALLLTFIAMNARSLWLMIIALSLLLASFGLMFSGLTLRTEHKVMEEEG